MVSVLLILTTVMVTVTAQQNLTPFGNASQSSSYSSDKTQGRPEYALEPPISNTFSLNLCSSTLLYEFSNPAWWRFEFYFDIAYITDITLYYREYYATRMDGYKLYITNTSNIPPNGYPCYDDPHPGLPDITQTISCHQLGKYVVYYDYIGSDEGAFVPGPIVELCYVAINGCFKGTWGTNCSYACPPKCIDQHCYPGNGSCVWGCDSRNCSNNICDIHTGVCSEGCEPGLAGQFCDMSKYIL